MSKVAKPAKEAPAAAVPHPSSPSSSSKKTATKASKTAAAPLPGTAAVRPPKSGHTKSPKSVTSSLSLACPPSADAVTKSLLHSPPPPGLPVYVVPPALVSPGSGSGSNSQRRSSLLKHADRSSPERKSGFLDTISLDTDHSAPDEDLDDDGIVASSRLTLARMSFDSVVVAAARLQDLMVAHAAAVTSARQQQLGQGAAEGGRSASAGAPPAPAMIRIDANSLSKRPLHEIADDLATQLEELGVAYQASSRAERQLLGVPATPGAGAAIPGRGLSVKQLRAVGGGQDVPSNCPAAIRRQVTPPPAFARRSAYPAAVDSALLGGDTFGSMTSTQLLGSGGDLDLIPGAGDQHHNEWMIDVGRANPGPRLVGNNTNRNNQFTYPDGTTVNFPISTFGELVHTEFLDTDRAGGWAEVVAPPRIFGQVLNNNNTPATDSNDVSAHVDPNAAPHPPIIGASSQPPARPPTRTSSNPMPLYDRGASPSPVGNGMRAELMQSYITALEERLSEKQRLEAMRDARRGDKKSREGSVSVASSLSHLAQAKSLKESTMMQNP